jgi:hypothetical protein
MLKKKVSDNHSVALKADKDNTLVITHEHGSNQNVLDIIDSNEFPTLSYYIMDEQQRRIHTVINKSSNIINQNVKWKYTDLNPDVHSMTGLIKLYKQSKPIGQIINWHNAYAYKI